MGKQLHVGNQRLGSERALARASKIKNQKNTQKPMKQKSAILRSGNVERGTCSRNQKIKKQFSRRLVPQIFFFLVFFFFFVFFAFWFCWCQYAIPPGGPYIQYEDEKILKQRACFKTMLLYSYMPMCKDHRTQQGLWET